MNPGQKHLQDMMARQQKQMSNQQKRNMQAAWMQKQQEKSRDQDFAPQDGAGSSGATTRWQGGGYFQPDERFSKVEAEVASLKKQFDAGRLSEDKFNEQLNDLMVEDDKGDWWMIGTKSDAWYRFDGQNWVQSTPPGRWVQGSSTVTGSNASKKAKRTQKGHPFIAIILFVILVVLFVVIGNFVGWFAFHEFGLDIIIPPDIPLLSLIIWVLGLIIAFRRARKTWRGW